MRPALALQVLQQVDHLRLDRDVERRDRLVAHDQLRAERQRAGDADALALAARELVREVGHLRGPQADAVEQRRHLRGALALVGHAVDQQRLADDVARGHARVERRERILEDDLHLLAGTAAAPLVDRPAMSWRRRAARCPTWARSGAGWRGRPWSCRSPHSPTRPSVSPAPIVKLDAVDGVDLADGAAQESASAPGSACSRSRTSRSGHVAHQPIAASQQAAQWPGVLLARRPARFSRQTSVTPAGSAAAKAQPAGSATAPARCRRSPQPVGVGLVLAAQRSRRGIEAIRPRYRDARAGEQLADRRLLDLAAGIHHDHAVAPSRPRRRDRA